ncbi:MAG: ImmA/IrrE family metallo-endopeptidase [Hydrogenophilales bacterium]|nr:ImmA/IrrE family metallo-endopeptidase [Hydrogenophilales bacterium]
MTPGQRAEARIAELGITDPRDLDVALIAMDAGMEVVYENLQGCEATLVGVGNRAIATVRRSTVRGRERFSVGHELGHWDMHRGRAFRCRVDDPDQNWASDTLLEKEADTYASHLLMPTSMFNPRVKALGTPGFREIEDLSEVFATSVLATCMRVADINTLPVILACYNARGVLRWRKAAADVPPRWWLRQQLDDDSFAYELLHNGKSHPSPGKQPAEVWFENMDADEYEMSECCIPSRAGEIMVMLFLGPKMLDARYDPHVGNRKFNQHGPRVARK